CDSANVDGRPGDEIVCGMDDYFSGSMEGGHGVFVLTYDATATPSAKLLWSTTVPLATGATRSVGASLGDLDGDGTYEETIALQGYGGASGWTTVVFDAAAGTTLAAIPGVTLTGIADLSGMKKPVILGYGAGGDLEAWSFARAATPVASMLW